MIFQETPELPWLFTGVLRLCDPPCITQRDVSMPYLNDLYDDDRGFWDADSQYQRSGGWLRHSLAVDRIKTPTGFDLSIADHGMRCGPLAFAAITGLSVEDVLRCFPECHFRPWISRNDMQRAFRKLGHEFVRLNETWPAVGLCLVQFTGPWTRRNFAQAALHHTHWIAVLGEYIYDINWGGWLPRQNWEEVVLQELLDAISNADGWRILTGYEVPISATMMGGVSQI